MLIVKETSDMKRAILGTNYTEYMLKLNNRYYTMFDYRYNYLDNRRLKNLSTSFLNNASEIILEKVYAGL